MTRYSYEKNGNHAQKLQGFIYLKGTENRKRSVNPFKNNGRYIRNNDRYIVGIFSGDRFIKNNGRFIKNNGRYIRNNDRDFLMAFRLKITKRFFCGFPCEINASILSL